jgi:16S rRNA (guanine(966)-N(2))-methyltransferase RsmD
MRVIAGALKGRRLKAPTWEGLRPTSDKLRETLFNILAPRVVDARVLDVYAGTGALGIEALSRGAAEAVFIDGDRRAQTLIAENLAHCGVETGYTIVRSSAPRGFDALRLDGQPSFDIVLLDPPYDEQPDAVIAVLEAVSNLLAPAGVLVLEHPRRRATPEVAGVLLLTREVTSGDSALTFYSPCPPLPSTQDPSTR